MTKPKLVLIIILLLIPVSAFLVFLFRADILSNPLKDVEPENSFLSTLVGVVNSVLGSPPDSSDDGDESIKEKFAKSGYPEEFFSFDVTTQPASFAIVDVDSADKSMVLQYILPFDRQGQIVKSKIDCSVKGSVILTLDPSSGATETAPTDKPLYDLATKNVDTLQGICGNHECSSIVGNCDLLKPK